MNTVAGSRWLGNGNVSYVVCVWNIVFGISIVFQGIIIFIVIIHHFFPSQPSTKDRNRWEDWGIIGAWLA
jgi:hypothetical protein